jgi:hypothetical protein
MFKVPGWSMIDNPYEFVWNDGNSLLITAGDSWTYGDSLGKTKVRLGRDDKVYRLDHIYGNLMAQELKSNWINLAMPGGSNSLIVSWVEMLLDTMSSQKYYRDIDGPIRCVITLTESGRHEDMRLIDRSLGTQQQVLEKITAEIYGRITVLMLKHPEVKFIIGHNFTDSVSTMPCKQSWLEVMLGKQIQNGTHIVISEHIEQMNYDARFPDVLDIMSRAEARMDLLDSCAYCYKEDSRHPNEQGHRMWADYLLGQI